jgi:hypothetical protein
VQGTSSSFSSTVTRPGFGDVLPDSEAYVNALQARLENAERKAFKAEEE